MKKKLTNGPNNAFGVVWALFRGLCLPADKYYLIPSLVVIKHERKKKKTYEWPKRRVLRRLGPFS